jgi:ABC-type amino acid transport substrate-binding protein
LKYEGWGEKKMAKIITIGLVVIMLVVGFAVGIMAGPLLLPQNASSTDTVWAHIQETGVIRVGTDPTWPPYQMLDEQTQEIVGFEIDIANECAKRLGLTIQWNDVAFGDIIQSVQQGALDMGVSGFSITSERLDQVSFTVPHSTTLGQVVMLDSTMEAKGITTVDSLEDFKTLGIKVGVQIGNVEQQELQDAGVEIATWSESDAPFLDMVSANPSVQAVYAETPITTNWIAQFADEGIQASAVYSHPYYPVAFVVGKNSHTLLDKMDGVIAEMIFDGTIEQLRAKWNAY